MFCHSCMKSQEVNMHSSGIIRMTAIAFQKSLPHKHSFLIKHKAEKSSEHAAWKESNCVSEMDSHCLSVYPAHGRRSLTLLAHESHYLTENQNTVEDKMTFSRSLFPGSEKKINRLAWTFKWLRLSPRSMSRIFTLTSIQCPPILLPPLSSSVTMRMKSAKHQHCGGDWDYGCWPYS